mgnify:CR=1 FL=1|tara:strand:- start:498 stop:1124 length:627 start_codon:yes stop_codon:yes gene_type:complete
MNVELNFEMEDVFIDTEPLDNKPFSPIIEIALISNTGEILFNEIIKPNDNAQLSDYKKNFLGFDQSKLDQARTIEYYRPALIALTKNKNICAWGKADINKLSFLKIHANYSDCCQRFSDKYGFYDRYHGNNTWVKLKDACIEIGYDQKKAHRALPDAEACRQVWNHLDNINAPIAAPYKDIKNSNLVVMPNFIPGVQNNEEYDNENTI